MKYYINYKNLDFIGSNLRKLLLIIFGAFLLVSCDNTDPTDGVGAPSNPFVGTWYYSSYEFTQDITTKSDQTTIPIMGTMSGLVPFENGLVIEGDGINETLNY